MMNLSQAVNRVQRSNLTKELHNPIIQGLHLLYEKQAHAVAQAKAKPAVKKAVKKTVKK